MLRRRRRPAARAYNAAIVAHRDGREQVEGLRLLGERGETEALVERDDVGVEGVNDDRPNGPRRVKG
jgi:hypothetical protein